MKLSRLLASASLLTAPAASAQDWLDNFNDGSATDGTPVTWIASPAFGAAFAVDAGDLRVNIDAGSPAISSPRVDAYFPAGASVRARMVALAGPGRYTVAFADQPTGIKGYVASFSTCGGGRIELFRGDVLGAIIILGGGTIPLALADGDEFYVQLDVFGGVVSARVWRPGEAFPAPQLSAGDATYADGVASIAIQDFGTGGLGCGGGLGGDFTDAAAVVRFAQASSTPLTHSGAGDLDADGLTNTNDFFAFLAFYASSDPRADVTGEGDINSNDFFAYLTLYAGDN